jgi:glycosyltransferase involved in cell wall biosynthesis
MVSSSHHESGESHPDRRCRQNGNRERPMKIALDGAGISPRLTGVGRYLQSLLRELIPLDPGIEYTLFLKDEVDPGLSFPNLRTVLLKRPGSYLLWQNTQLRKAVTRGAFDFFWSPNYSLPFFLPTPSILTVHDISWKSIPGNYSPAIRLYRDFTGMHSFKKATILFTDSDFSKTEILHRTDVPADKVKRIHLGVDKGFCRASAGEITDFKTRHGLFGKQVIGFLGSFFKRRHIPEIITALEIVRQQHPDMVLLLVGENYALPPGMITRDQPGVLWLRRLPEDEINAFYSSLSLFLYMSEYEGFGLPPMEALNCGTPSLLLRRSSLAEIYGDLALFVDRPDPVLIAEAMCGFWQRQEETKRQFLGRWQARKPYFSWKRAAEEYLREIRELP